MTDHRVTDLSYGHLGKASYDTEENQWTFSNTKDKDQRIQQLLPLTEHFPSSFQNAPKKDGISSQIAKSQLKWLFKNRPETFPANTVTSTLAKVHGAGRTGLSRSGSLLTVGRAVDVDRISRSRRPRILCMPCGGGGHILQLIRPTPERRGWGKHSAAKLSLLELESSERGYWVGTGGAIRQIESSDDGNESGTWLAVRQDTIITIFRPLYGKLHNSTGPSTGFCPAKSSSRLNPNPVASLSSERTASEEFMDVSFNPWYARQFALVDSRGHWFIWDLERQDGKGSPEQAISGKKGVFHDSCDPDPMLKTPPDDYADGWYRILWICNINTLVVCNRRNIAVIDIKAAPIKLPITQILAGNCTEWILDLKRSSDYPNHLFILTTSRIFWIEIVPPGKDGDQTTSFGIKVVLSYRHFRDPNDETLKLTLVNNDSVTALISSAKVLLVNYYCFVVNADAPGLGASFQGSFTLVLDSNDPDTAYKSLQTLCVMPAPLTSTSVINSTGRGLQFLNQDVRFFQMWAFTADLGLNSTLLSVLRLAPEEISRPRLLISAPTFKLTQSLRPQGPQYVKDSFIVADGVEYERSLTHGYTFQDSRVHSNANQDRDDLRFRLNWKRIFQHGFGLSNVQIETTDEDTELQEEGESRLKEFLDHASSHIHEGINGAKLTSNTLHEISGISGPSGKIEQASSNLRDFLDTLRQVQIPEKSPAFKFVLSNLTACPGIQFRSEQVSNDLDPMIIFNRLLDNWMASLPGDLSAKSRFSKFNIIRQTAIEVFLSSFAVSLQNKATDMNIAPVQPDGDDAVLPEADKEYATTRESSPANFSSQVVPFLGSQPSFNLPTPAQTPSLYSRATSASEHKEDPAISRLRQYAVSIRSKTDFGKSPILSQWPSVPGSDPANYSWAAKREAGDDGPNEAERGQRIRKEETRRRRRTEKFLNEESATPRKPVSQPMVVIPSGSQPVVAHNGFSSQTVEDIPMTQPDRGAFGSRSTQTSKKKPKKVRIAGFR